MMNEKTYDPRDLTKDLIDKKIIIKGYIEKRSEHKAKKIDDEIIDYLEIILKVGFRDKFLVQLQYSEPKTIKKIDTIIDKLVTFEGIYSYISNRGDLIPCLISDQFPIIKKTPLLDIDKITTGITQSTRNNYKIIEKIFDKLERERPEITYNDIIEEAKRANMNELEVKKQISTFKKEGIIFEPRKEIYKKLP